MEKEVRNICIVSEIERFLEQFHRFIKEKVEKKRGLGGIRKNIIISFFAKTIVPLGTNNRLDECAQS